VPINKIMPFGKGEQ